MIDKYPVITLCGSTRFKEQFLEAQKRLTLAGNIVINVGGYIGQSTRSEIEYAKAKRCWTTCTSARLTWPTAS